MNLDDVTMTSQGVDRINATSDRVFSAAIMAGWIGPAATKVEQATLVAELQWLWENNVCKYHKQLQLLAQPQEPPLAGATPTPTPNGTGGSGGSDQGSSTVVTVSVLWRCSINKPKWKAPDADSIDFATYVLGYASPFLPTGFYTKYAV